MQCLPFKVTTELVTNKTEKKAIFVVGRPFSRSSDLRTTWHWKIFFGEEIRGRNQRKYTVLLPVWKIHQA
jgi:hypothetical protein